jgi:hypothetical protein
MTTDVIHLAVCSVFLLVWIVAGSVLVREY